MRCLRIASRTCFLKNSWKSGAQKAALWRRSSSVAFAPHFVHFTRRLVRSLHRSPGTTTRHDGAELDHVVVTERLVGGDQLVAADDEHGLGDDLQVGEDVLHTAPARHFDFTPRIAQYHLHLRPRGIPATFSRRGSAAGESRRAAPAAATTARDPGP